MFKISPQKWLIFILALAFLIRIAGVSYGLPLWLVDDEPPFTLAALKMLELKTLLPVLHLADFKTVLYYPPYLSYLYLPFFAAFAGIKFLFYKGAANLFASYLLADLSGFFIITRVINVFMGVISIYLIYKIAQNIFKEEIPALFAAFFVSTSLIHVALSMASRHWLSVFSFSTLVLFWLSKPGLDFRKKYFLAIISAGIGIGFAIINSILFLLIAFWYIFYEKRPLLNILKEKFFYGLYALFFALLTLPYILYPGSLGFRADTTASAAKTIFGAITSPIFFAKTIALSEPLIIIFAILGLLFAFRNVRNLFWTFFTFIYAYSIIFYLVFRFEPRFFMGLLPFYVILAGYGFWETQKLLPRKILPQIFFLLLLIPLILSLRFGQLALRNDSRTSALKWVEANIPAGSKIMVLARLTNLPTNKAAAAEQEKLDPVSLRKVYLAQAEMAENSPNFKSFHALNFRDLSNESFYENIDSYVKQNHYEYLFIQPGYRDSERFKNIMKNSMLLKSHAGGDFGLSLAESQFIANPLGLFKTSELGPRIEIYKINQ
ncbi:MAG: hypothetical protein Q8Q46_02830 [Candidatus Giovannonibacteria bacterium]|nr:hypothetical protein [Candidatus Giovannonibacteria bacterium]